MPRGAPHTDLSPELLAHMQAIKAKAREYGLDFVEVVFEVLDFETMNQIASYGGFPVRYPHWRWGMEYDRLSKRDTYGMGRIYEMVINNDPCYAYLLEGNSLVDQKMVMAHVYAHCDFFKNNYFFSKTNRKMIDGMANHATRVRKHIERFGIERVESFVDTCLSIDDLIDPNAPFLVRHAPRSELEQERALDEEAAQTREVPRLRAKSYMDKFINPPEILQRRIARQRERQEQARKRFPERPERDVLLFLLEHAPLERWERDILNIIREEAYYFVP